MKETTFKKQELHPGRRGPVGLKQIKCVLCDWTPPPNELGGCRWKMLAVHYEEHIDELTK